MTEEEKNKGFLSEVMKSRLMSFFREQFKREKNKSPKASREIEFLKPSDKRGYPVAIIPTEKIDNAEFLPTFLNALLSGRKPEPPLTKYTARYLRSRVVERDIVIILDSSKSSSSYLDSIRLVLGRLFASYLSPSSRLGLISISEGNARKIFMPTTNRRRVFGQFSRLMPGGYTKLSDALKLAYLQVNTLKQMGRKPMIIIVSDCFPEPVPLGLTDLWDSKLYRDVRAVVKNISNINVPIIVIDPSRIPEQIASTSPGRRLAHYIAERTSGNYVNIPVSVKGVKDTNKEAMRLAQLLEEAEKAGFGSQARAMGGMDWG